MPVLSHDDACEALLGDEVVARAELTDLEPALVEPVSIEEARAAESSYAGLTFHPFPTCFACGVGRGRGDGLRIFPGQVTDQDGAARVAASWTPDSSVADPIDPIDPIDSVDSVADHVDSDRELRVSLATTWAALDCIGGWAGDLEERLMVLARMTARVDALPVVGEDHVVVGLARGEDGRKTFTASTLYDADGRIVARAEHVWVAVNPADFA
jgi:hypothetical protein